MVMFMKRRYKHICEYCGYGWNGFKKNPVSCPKCKIRFDSIIWFDIRKEMKYKIPKRCSHRFKKIGSYLWECENCGVKIKQKMG